MEVQRHVQCNMYIYMYHMYFGSRLKDQATRKGAVSVPTLRRLWTVSDSFKLR